MQSYAGAWTRAALASADRLLESQGDALETAADWSADTIAADGLVHVFGSGHSRIPVEEMFPRYGSYPGFHPIVELSTTFHTQVAGANGMRQAMFIERVPGLAEMVLRNYTFAGHDLYLGFSVGGSSALPVEMMAGARARGVKTIAVTNLAMGGTMAAHADLVIDLQAPPGDAAVTIDGLDTPVGPVSTLLYTVVVNEIKVRTAARLVARGCQPPVITSAVRVGAERSLELFEAAFHEHARRASRALDQGTSAAPAA